MNETRRGVQFVTLNNKIYAIGGKNVGTKKTVECYDSSTDKWSYVAPTLHENYYGSATSYQNKIYVLSENAFEVYDPYSNAWKDLSRFDVGFGSELISFNDKLWSIVGGTRYSATPTKRVFEFDISTNTWTQLPDMDVERKNHRAVVVNF